MRKIMTILATAAMFAAIENKAGGVTLSNAKAKGYDPNKPGSWGNGFYNPSRSERVKNKINRKRYA